MRLIVIVIASVLASACQTADPADRPQRRIRAAYTSAVDIGDVPSLMALRALEAAGYEVVATFYAQPELAVEALASGGADVASGGSRAFWAAAVKGADFRMLMQHVENGYRLAAVAGVQGCADLDGRTVALSSPGSLPTALGQAFLRRCGQASARVVIMPHSGDRLSALLNRAVDAAVVQRADVARLVERAPADFTTVDAFEDAFPDLDFEGVFTTAAFLRDHRASAVDYVRERIRANRTALDTPAALVEEAARWPAMGTLEPAVIDGEVAAPAWTRDAGIDRASIAATLEFFAGAGSLPASLPVERAADFSIAGEAMHALERAGSGR